MENIIILMYLIEVFESLSNTVILISIFTLIGLLIYCFISTTERGENAFYKLRNYFYCCFAAIILTAFIPNKTVMYVAIGSYAGNTILENKDVNSILNKSYDIIDHKLDEILEDINKNKEK